MPSLCVISRSSIPPPHPGGLDGTQQRTLCYKAWIGGFLFILKDTVVPFFEDLLPDPPWWDRFVRPLPRHWLDPLRGQTGRCGQTRNDPLGHICHRSTLRGLWIGIDTNNKSHSTRPVIIVAVWQFLHFPASLSLPSITYIYIIISSYR